MEYLFYHCDERKANACIVSKHGSIIDEIDGLRSSGFEKSGRDLKEPALCIARVSRFFE